MTTEEFRELVQEGDLIRIRTADADVVGYIEKILSDGVKLSRLESGRPYVVKISLIETLDFDVDLPHAARSAAPVVIETAVLDVDTHLVPLASDAPQQPESKAIVGSDTKQVDKAEELNWMPPAEGAVEGSVINYHPTQFGFLKTSSGTAYFRLEQVEDEMLRAELNRGKILRKRWKVTCTIVRMPDGNIRGDHIRLCREDVRLLKKMGPPVKRKGVLKKDSAGNCVLIDQNNRQVPLPCTVSQDPYLTFYMQDSGQQESLPVMYVLQEDKGECAVVSGAWLRKEERSKLLEIYEDRISKDKRASISRDLAALSMPPAQLCAYQELAGYSEKIVSPNTTYKPKRKSKAEEPVKEKNQSKSVSQAKLEPAKHTVSAVGTVKSKNTATLEEEQAQLKELLAQAEQYFAALPLPEPDPEKSAYQWGAELVNAKDPASAEPYFYQAIVSGVQAEEAMGALVPTYLRGKDREESRLRIARGLLLLNRYPGVTTPEKYNTARVTLLEKSGFDHLLAAELRRVIPEVLKPSLKMHYCQRMGRILMYRGAYEEAAGYFRLWKETKQDNIALLGIVDGQDSKYAVMEPQVNQSLAVCYYHMPGCMEQAKAIAAELLRDKADPIAEQILRGSLGADAAAEERVLPDEDDTYDAYDDYDVAGQEIPPYAQACLESAKLLPIKKTLRGKFVDNNYKGTPEDAKADVDTLSRGMSDVPPGQRDAFWAMIARIVFQTMQNYRDEKQRLEKNYHMPSRLWEKVGHALLSQADFKLQQKSSDLDSARFLYMESIPLFLATNADWHNAFVRMLATVLRTRDQQAEASNTVFAHSEKIAGRRVVRCNNDVYVEWIKACRDRYVVRDLLLCAFLVDVSLLQEQVKFLREAIRANPLLLEETERLFSVLEVVKSADTKPEDAFKDDWEMARALYRQKWEGLTALLHRSADNMDKPQVLAEHLRQIQDSLARIPLFVTDQNRLKDYCAHILTPLVRLQQKDSFEQKRDDYNSVLASCDRLANMIHTSPTKLTYDHLLGVLETTKGRISKALNELYCRSTPELVLELSAAQAYVDEQDRYARIEIEIRNRINLQPAILYDLKLRCVGSGVEGEFLNHLSAEVRGGEQVSQEWGFRLDQRQLEERYFDVEAELTYGYYSEAGQEEKSVRRVEFNVSLANAADFVEVPNPYLALREGNGVPDKKMFFGRDDYIRDLVASLRLTNGDMLCHQGIVMYGQKRTGKTAIMERLSEHIRQTYGDDTYIIVKVGSVGKTKELIGFFCRMIYELESELMRHHKPLYRQLLDAGVTFPSEDIEDQTEHWRAQSMFLRAFGRIDAALQELGGKSRYIPLFLLDEFTYFYNWIVEGTLDPDFMLFWKAFHQDYRICTISIGMDSMPEFVSYAHANMTNSFGCLNLQQVSYLDREATIALADEPLRTPEGESRFQPEALEYIYELTAGSAFLTVILCSALVEYINDNKTVRITRTVVDLVVQKRLFAGVTPVNERTFEPQITDPGVFGDEGAAVAADNRTLLTCIALNCDSKAHELRDTNISCIPQLTDPTEERREYLLERLVRRDVLVRRTSNNMNFYRIKLNLLRRWLLFKNGMEDHE